MNFVVPRNVSITSNSLDSRTKWCEMSVGWVANISVCSTIDECQLIHEYITQMADCTYKRIAVTSKQRRRVEQKTINHLQPRLASYDGQPQSIRSVWTIYWWLPLEMLHQKEQNRVAVVECYVAVLQGWNAMLRRYLQTHTHTHTGKDNHTH